MPHVVCQADDGGRNRYQRTMVVVCSLATPTSSPLIATCRPATVTASPGKCTILKKGWPRSPGNAPAPHRRTRNDEVAAPRVGSVPSRAMRYGRLGVQLKHGSGVAIDEEPTGQTPDAKDRQVEYQRRRTGAEIGKCPTTCRLAGFDARYAAAPVDRFGVPVLPPFCAAAPSGRQYSASVRATAVLRSPGNYAAATHRGRAAGAGRRP